MTVPLLRVPPLVAWIKPFTKGLAKSSDSTFNCLPDRSTGLFPLKLVVGKLYARFPERLQRGLQPVLSHGVLDIPVSATGSLKEGVVKVRRIVEDDPPHQIQGIGLTVFEGPPHEAFGSDSNGMRANL